MSKSGLTFSLAGFGKDGGYWICLRKGILRKVGETVDGGG